MGEDFIILDMDKLKIVTKYFKVTIFNCYSDALRYAKKNIKNFRLIKL